MIRTQMKRQPTIPCEVRGSAKLRREFIDAHCARLVEWFDREGRFRHHYAVRKGGIGFLIEWQRLPFRFPNVYGQLGERISSAWLAALFCYYDSVPSRWTFFWLPTQRCGY